MSKKLENKVRIQFRLAKIESVEKWEMAQEWFKSIGSGKVSKTKNDWLEGLFTRAIDNEILDNLYASRIEEVIENKINKLSNKNFNRYANYSDQRLLPILKLLIVMQKQSNFIINSLVEAGIINSETLVEPHEQQISDPPFIKTWKDELDSKFTNYKNEEIIKQYFGDYSNNQDYNNVSRDLLKRFVKIGNDLGITKAKPQNNFDFNEKEFSAIGQKLIEEYSKQNSDKKGGNKDESN